MKKLFAMFLIALGIFWFISLGFTKREYPCIPNLHTVLNIMPCKLEKK